MTDAWPGTLPQALQINNATLGEADGTVEYAPDSGPTISRLASSGAMAPISGSVICTSDQIATFRTFFVTTILGGSLPFNFPDPMGGSALLVKFTKQGGMPNWTALGGDTFQLNLVLAVLP